MNRTNIEWTDYSVNPIDFVDADGAWHWHCEKVSPGCANCYAEGMGHRFGSPPFTPAGGAGLTPRLRVDRLKQVLNSRAPAGSKVFVGDMTDLFGDWVTDEMLDQIFAVMMLRADLHFQVLTKRPERMAAYLKAVVHGRRKIGDALRLLGIDGLVNRLVIANALGVYMGKGEAQASPPYDPPANIWPGVSAEDQAHYSTRYGAWVRIREVWNQAWWSLEPLLGRIELDAVLAEWWESAYWPAWVVVGGESGPGARPMHPEWVRCLRDQCRVVGVPFFFKQWGAWVPDADCGTYWFESREAGEFFELGKDCFAMNEGELMRYAGKKSAGRELDGRVWDEFPPGMVAVKEGGGA